MKRFERLTVVFALTFGVSAIPSHAQYELPPIAWDTAGQTVTIVGTRDRCKVDLMDSGAIVYFGCPGHPTSAQELYFGYVLPAILADPAVSIAEKCKALADAFEPPCINSGESPSAYSTRAVYECADNVANALPTGSVAFVDRKAAALFACSPKRADFAERAITGQIAPC